MRFEDVEAAQTRLLREIPERLWVMQSPERWRALTMDMVRSLSVEFILIRRSGEDENQVSLFEVDVAAQTVGASHAGDPVTSKMAAERQRLRAGSNRWRVLSALLAAGEDGLTGYQIGVRCGMLRTAADTRRKELAEMELVEVVPNRLRPTDTGSPAQVHRITEKGRTVWNSLAGRVEAGELRPEWRQTT